MAPLAVDRGANGGKLYLGRFDDGFEVEEVHRFDNRPVARDGRYYWDTDRLREEIVAGIELADERATLDTVGVDSWGIDFGLLWDGELIQQPYSYRDPALTSTREDALAEVSERELFEATGINHWNTPNTLWQYHYLASEESDLLDRADRLLFTPQLVSFLLGGRPAGERTIASTSQMLDPRTGEWAEGLIDRLDLSLAPLPDLEPPGASLGGLAPDIADRLDVSPELLLPASHDTASAVAGLPLTDGSRAFVSTGTWFIPGVELDEPRIDDDAFAVGGSNELGVEGTVRFLKNVTGFFLLEECREAWRSAGRSVAFDELLAAARDAEPFGPLVDPESDRFGIRGNMPPLIREFCVRTDQSPPGGMGEMTRCILESLAARTALVVEELLDVAGVDDGPVHLGGGGVRNELFCEMLASALGRTVRAGPADATAVGNILTQAVAAGHLDGVDEGRELVSDAFDVTEYEPENQDDWARAKDRMADLVRADP
jgi:rhamnulokinase